MKGGKYTLGEKIFTVEEAAEILRLTPLRVKRLLQMKKIKGFKATGERLWRIKESDLQEFIDNSYNVG